jgi:acetyltransferase
VNGGGVTGAATAELRGGIASLLFPCSLALVGASPSKSQAIANALRGGGSAWGVHPSRSDALGLLCAPSVAALPEVPETAFLLVGHRSVEAAFEEAAAAGVRSFVIPGIGAEAGAEAAEVAGRLATRADELGAAAIGHNCMGIARPDGSSAWLGTIPATFLPGHVSVVAQSGSIGEALIACGPRIGFRVVVSCGGELVRDAADIVGFFAEDERTQVVGVFLETVRRPAAFAQALERCAGAGKPVVCLKVGRSPAAARAALAHTGALVGSDRAFSALLRRHGAIEVDDFHDFLETLEVLGRRRRPRGLRVAAVSESGGECALLADHGEAAGMPFERLPAELSAALTAEFPNFLAPENPLDCWAIDDESIVYPRSLELLAGSGAYDVLLAQIDLSQYRGSGETEWCELIVRALARVCAGTGLFPAVTSIHSSDPPPAIAELARELDVALLRGSAHAMRALAAAARWRPGGWAPERDRWEPPAVDWPPEGGPLAELESAAILERYGVRFPPSRRASAPAEAARAAEELGFPVVVKVDGLAHKSAAGGVVLGVASADAAARAAERLGGRVVVAAQVAPGPEAICGMTRDPDHGPVVALGLGGIAVEALGLAAVALAPLTLDEARELVGRAPGVAGVAGGAAQEALARTLVAVGRLAVDHPQVAEIDVNPLILSDDGAVAVDALIVVDPGGAA